MPDALDRAIALVTDGADVDWELLLDDAVSDRERLLIEDLRALSRLAAEDPLAAPGTTIGVGSPAETASVERWQHLELLEEIGRGAHGVVYRAWDTRLAREVALKLRPSDETDDTIAEARRLARVSHPNVVSIHGAERVQGQVGLWMEFLRGRTLEQIVRDQGPFSAGEVIGILFDVCSAVASLHALGIVHRDIKAQNVMREPGGRIVVMDMSASVESSTDDAGVTELAGTPLYMSPELLEGAAASEASDVYAIGVLAYRLVTADFPIHARTIGDVRRAHADVGLRPLRDVRPDLPQLFVAIVERCLARDRKDRFAGVASLERALAQIDRQRRARGIGWRTFTATLVAVCAMTAVLAWFLATRSARPTAGGTSVLGISADLYKLFAGYEELAFSKRMTDPRAAEAASRSALNLIRESLPGNHPIFALLYGRLADSWLRLGDLRQATRDLGDAGAHTYLTVGDDHPYSSVVAVGLARSALAAGDKPRAVSEILRALRIRSRVLGLKELGARDLPFVESGLERALGSASLDEDADGDGLLDLFEIAAGLSPRSAASANGDLFDDDRDEDGDGVSNRLSFGLTGSPFLTWAQYGATQPQSHLWQSPPQFPLIQRPELGSGRLPAWSITARRSQGYFTQRLSAPHSARALEKGFSLLLRVRPDQGIAGAAVDTSPAGPRFDITLRRLDEQRVEVCLQTSVVPRQGMTVVVNASSTGRLPIFELRYRPQARAAALYIDGRRVLAGYSGHHQFQEPSEGSVGWSVIRGDGMGDDASAAFNLVWFEIF